MFVLTMDGEDVCIEMKSPITDILITRNTIYRGIMKEAGDGQDDGELSGRHFAYFSHKIDIISPYICEHSHSSGN